MFAPCQLKPGRASTATKLVTLPVRSDTPSNAIAFQSLYAVAPLPFDVAYIVSLADGSIRRVSAGPNWKFATLVLVMPTELWAVLDAVNGQSGVALAKYSL
jgi:hypothetical protein